MTVKITKPDINIREKLTELDYSTVPYEKMPAGSVIQHKVVRRQGDISTTTAAVWVDVLSFKFAPRLMNSRLEFFMNMSVGSEANVGHMWRIYNVTDGVELERTGWHINGDTTADALDTRFSWYHLHDPNSLEEKQYTLQGYKDSTAGRVWFHTYGTGTSSFFGVTEIKDGSGSSISSLA